MRESDLFDEGDVRKPTWLSCPFCRESFSYEVRWRQRIKRKSLPGNASSEDRRRFSKAQSYLVRIDDKVGCQNRRCRKQFEIASFQSVVFLAETESMSDGNRKQLNTKSMSDGNRKQLNTKSMSDGNRKQLNTNPSRRKRNRYNR